MSLSLTAIQRALGRESLPNRGEDDRGRDAAAGAEPAQVHARAPYARPVQGNQGSRAYPQCFIRPPSFFCGP